MLYVVQIHEYDFFLELSVVVVELYCSEVTYTCIFNSLCPLISCSEWAGLIWPMQYVTSCTIQFKLDTQ